MTGTDDRLGHRILVLAPTARDTDLTRAILAEAGIECAPCGDLEELGRALHAGAGAVLVAEEALAEGSGRLLGEALARQPAWSDIPVLVLTRQGADSATVAEAMDRLGNVTLLERPTRVAALISAARTALRARQRQYQIRAHILARERTETALRESQSRLEAELDAMSRLHRLSTRLPASPDLRSALDEILDAAISTSGADMGHIQVFHPETSTLEIAAQRGFRQDFLDRFRSVSIDEGYAFGAAMRRLETVVIADLEKEPAFAPPGEAAAGFRAVQSVPFLKSGGGLLGVLSTHFRAPRLPAESDLRMLELHARQAAHFIERLRAEEARRESEERLTLALEGGGLGAWDWDLANGKCIWSEQHFKLLGYVPTPSGDAHIEMWRRLLHPEDRERVERGLARSRRERSLYGLEHRILRAGDGQVAWLHVSGRFLYDAAGEPTRMIGVLFDITERKKAEEGLREADRLKDEFLATLAHELRNPLAPIRNSLHILKLTSANEGAAERVCEMMERQVNHMVRLVDDLLEVSRLTRGKIELQKEWVELAAVLRSAVETSRPLIEAAGHQLAISIPVEPLTLEADIVRLAQVFSNLLNNAAKYTEEGGRIWLTAEREEGMVVVSVRDTGVGIPEAMLSRVFDMFTQVDRSARRAQGGLGIGLTLVRSLALMHGGDVEARSAGAGQGSEFIVRLPLAANPHALDAAQPAARPALILPPRRVLVVDDNRDAADSLGILLKLLGADVQVVHDGPAAIEAARAHRPAIVLLDLGMPGMDGYEVARRLRRQRETADVTLIALTGWSQEQDRRRSRAAGFDHHLIKPADVGALLALIVSEGDRDGGLQRDP